MDITSFVLGMKLGGGDKEAADFNANLAATMLTRNPEYLGDEKVLDTRGFVLPDGGKLGNLQPYSMSGFHTITHWLGWQTVIFAANTFYGSTKLEVIDTISNSWGAVNFQENALNSLTNLKTIIIRRFEDKAITYVSFNAGATTGASSDFYVYVPRADYDTIVANVDSENDVPASRYRILEDYPAIDRWNEKFTVRFFDGDTLLKTEIVKYGASASHTPTKEGYVFVGWDKDVSKVTEDMDVYAVWRLDFATASWQTISQVVNDGRAAEEFQLGDTKTVTLTYADGTTEDVEFQIASLDCDELYSSLTDNRICMIAKHVLDTPQIWDTNTKADTYYQSGKAIANYILNDLTPSFPDDLKSVWKVLGQVKYSGATDLWGKGKNDYVLLPSSYAVTGLHNVNTGSNPTSTSKYERLDLFKDKSNEFALAYSNNICKTRDGTAVTYWTSSTYKPSTSLNYKIPAYVTTAGKLAYASDYSTVARYIRPAFFV